MSGWGRWDPMLLFINKEQRIPTPPALYWLGWDPPAHFTHPSLSTLHHHTYSTHSQPPSKQRHRMFGPRERQQEKRKTREWKRAGNKYAKASACLCLRAHSQAADSLIIRESISDRAIESVGTFQRANSLPHHPPQPLQDRTTCTRCRIAFLCVDVCICVPDDHRSMWRRSALRSKRSQTIDPKHDFTRHWEPCTRDNLIPLDEDAKKKRGEREINDKTALQ